MESPLFQRRFPSVFLIERILKEKETAFKAASFKRSLDFALHRTGNFTRTQATGAGVNSLGGPIYDCFHALYIGFPSSVRAPMGVRNLNAEGYLFATDVTLCHDLHLLWKLP